jgi:SAM-dependent methyltransferase
MEQSFAAETLQSYYNRSNRYLEHLRQRTPEQLRAYVTAFARVVGPGGRVADLGCGTGLSTILLNEQNLRAYGLDISLPFLRETYDATSVPVAQSDITHLPFGNGSLDGIGLNAVIEHVADVESLLIEMVRVLRPGGWLIIYSPNLLSPFTPIKRAARSLLDGGRIRSPFYDTASTAILYSLECALRLIRKRRLPTPSFEFRRPSLEETAADYDSVFVSNQVDLAKYLASQGLRIDQIAQGRGVLGGLIASIFPWHAGGVGIIAQKSAGAPI